LKATIPQTQIAKVTVQQVDVGQLTAGPLSIGRLVLDDVDVGISTGTVRLRNLRVGITLKMALEWSVSVSIPFVGDFGWSGTIDFGTQTATVPLGNVAVPGLQSLTAHVGRLDVSNVTAVIDAIRNLRLGSLVVEQIQANGVEAPTPGFQLAGIGLGSAEIDGIGVPKAAATDSTVGRVHGQALPVGGLTIPNFALPQANIGEVNSQSLDTSATSNPFVFSADAGVLEVDLKITPGARMQADELRLTNVRASTSVGQIELQNVVLPYDVLDVKLSQLGIETIDIPKIEVS